MSPWPTLAWIGVGLLPAWHGDGGLTVSQMARVDACVEKAIHDRQIPGAVVLVGRENQVVFHRAYGSRAIIPGEEPMTEDTVFDLASLTKPIATASSIMVLIDQGKLRLEDRLGEVLPEFASHGKGAITIEQLLRHRSGLIADNPLSDYVDGIEQAWNRLQGLRLQGTPGETFLYSDVNYLILGRVVERVGEMPLDEFAQKHVFNLVGMNETKFLRLSEKKTPQAILPICRIAPTEPADGVMKRGRVHDPRAERLDGVAGHAGLYSTAADLSKFAQMLLDQGQNRDGRSVIKPETVKLMISSGETPEGQKRGLGWDIATPFSSPRGLWFGPRSFGHTGFTGTSLWIDPESRTYVIVLTSRLHPDGKGGSPIRLRSEIASTVGEPSPDPDDAPRENYGRDRR